MLALLDNVPLQPFVDSTVLLFMLLNPFLLSIYLLDLIQQMHGATFRRALLRGSIISGVAFILFAIVGDAVFSDVLHVRFASFLIFGGIVFLVISLRFVMVGPAAIRDLRGGSPEQIAGSIAMPFMIGPGTVSASIVAGSKLPPVWAALAICTALVTTTICVILLKMLHDAVRTKYEPLVDRYIDIIGRITALLVGTFAIEMILNGIELWIGIAKSDGTFNGG